MIKIKTSKKIRVGYMVAALYAVLSAYWAAKAPEPDDIIIGAALILAFPGYLVFALSKSYIEITEAGELAIVKGWKKESVRVREIEEITRRSTLFGLPILGYSTWFIFTDSEGKKQQIELAEFGYDKKDIDKVKEHILNQTKLTLT